MCDPEYHIGWHSELVRQCIMQSVAPESKPPYEGSMPLLGNPKPKFTAYHEARVIVCRVRKNASTSLGRALDTVSPKERRQETGLGKERIRELYDNGYLCAAIIRDPMDRLLSAWRYFTHGTKQVVFGIDVTEDVKFEDFVRQVLSRDLTQLDQHFQPQSLLLTDYDGLFLPDRIIRFENLTEDWETFRTEMADRGLHFPELTHAGNTDKRVRPITPGVIGMMHKYLHEDYRILGYQLPSG